MSTNQTRTIPAVAKWTGWVSFTLVVLSTPFSAILFTGAVILTQLLLIPCGIAAAMGALVSTISTVVVYTLIAVFVAPDFLFEVFFDTTNLGRDFVLVFSVTNYSVFLIGLGIGIWRHLEKTFA